jgi:hypothetical protein
MKKHNNNIKLIERTEKNFNIVVICVIYDITMIMI